QRLKMRLPGDLHVDDAGMRVGVENPGRIHARHGNAEKAAIADGHRDVRTVHERDFAFALRERHFRIGLLGNSVQGLPECDILEIELDLARFLGPAAILRSEERRVGKECRSRWWSDHEKKKWSGDE